MTEKLRSRIVKICEEKIVSKGDNVGVSLYTFFANKNEDPTALMEVAQWWIKKHQLDHFEKAHKIKDMIQRGL